MERAAERTRSPREHNFDVVAAPPCTPVGDVVTGVGRRTNVEVGDGVAPLLVEQRLLEHAVGRQVGAVALLRWQSSTLMLDVGFHHWPLRRNGGHSQAARQDPPAMQSFHPDGTMMLFSERMEASSVLKLRGR
jgi:hypothetical protein